jgi:outer membrane biosynthesis protein TonB
MKVVNCIHALGEIALKDNVHPHMQHMYEENSIANYEAQLAAPESREAPKEKKQPEAKEEPKEPEVKEEPKEVKEPEVKEEPKEVKEPEEPKEQVTQEVAESPKEEKSETPSTPVFISMNFP